jgi:ATP-dependent Clp protease adapter protein ClpS
MSGTDIQLEEKIKVVVSEPKRWKVILLNDDSTPMEFVVSILIEIF